MRVAINMQFNDIVDGYRAKLVEDEYGTHRNWAAPSRIFSANAVVLPTKSTESDNPDRELTEVTVSIYLKPVSITAHDRLKVNGVWYEVRGEPVTWKGRTASYMRINARRIS
jgi:hypothetical protein